MFDLLAPQAPWQVGLPAYILLVPRDNFENNYGYRLRWIQIQQKFFGCKPEQVRDIYVKPMKKTVEYALQIIRIHAYHSA